MIDPFPRRCRNREEALEFIASLDEGSPKWDLLVWPFSEEYEKCEFDLVFIERKEEVQP